MATVKSAEPKNNSFSINHIFIRYRSNLLSLGFLKFLLVLILQQCKVGEKFAKIAIFVIAKIHRIDLEALLFRILKIHTVKI